MELRVWTERILGGDQAHVVDILTTLEVVSALQRLEAAGEIESDWATAVQRRSFGWPFVRERLTQPRIERIWELRRMFTPHEAAYVATAEALQAEHRDGTALLTADPGVSGATQGGVACTILTFPGTPPRR